MNASKWPGPGECDRLLGRPLPPPPPRAFDFGNPSPRDPAPSGTTPSGAAPRRAAPRGTWPAAGSPVSPPARPLPWPEPAAPGSAPPAAGHAVGGGRRWHVVGYPAVLLAGIAIGVAAGGLPGTGNRPAPAAADGRAPTAAAPAAPGTGAGDGEAATEDGATDGGTSHPDRGHRFGDTVRLADGSTVTASAPVAARPGDGGERTRRHVRIRVTYADPGGEPAAGDDVARDAEVTDRPATLTLRLGVAGTDVTFTNADEPDQARD